MFTYLPCFIVHHTCKHPTWFYVHSVYLGPLLDITVTSGVQKEGSMKMALCSMVFNSRQSALCIYSGILQSVQHVSNSVPTGMMLYLLWDLFYVKFSVSTIPWNLLSR